MRALTRTMLMSLGLLIAVAAAGPSLAAPRPCAITIEMSGFHTTRAWPLSPCSLAQGFPDKRSTR